MSRRGWWKAFFLPALAASVGCIAIVGDDGESLGLTCRFHGDSSTECGRCIQSSCQPQVDACCKSNECHYLLSSLDDCASTSSSTSCTALHTPSGARTGLYPPSVEDLRDCFTTSCAAACGGAGADGGSRDAPTSGGPISCTDSTSSCSCSFSAVGAGNSTSCDESLFGNSALCCQKLDWPAPNLRCSCSQVWCQRTSSGCECGTSVTANLTSCSPPSGGHCCAFGSGCKCGSAGCASYETEVATCSASALSCNAQDEKRTASCR